ncbi:DUF2971 domain-containing protein [Motiliproteus sediminis]|uniref:DUF2971 domain-containing protein n=1 Tax=Motiliproteus sediminis TaxID=1468178 RepID=UPI001AEF39EB|nr:DUF2971 domain-containing protein [Motiliproteus sediminis]
MIYKFRSFNSDFKFQPFTEGKLYFASPNQFNDPYELKPKVVGLDTLEKREAFVDSFINKNLNNLNFKQRKEERRKALRRLLDIDLVEKDIHDTLSQYGIFSTAKRWEHILMWSHYADSHKGFCIGFDFNQNFDREMGLPITVTYSDRYPELTPGQLSDYDQLFRSTVGTKSDAWSYEEEVRYIKLKRDGGAGLYSFSKEKIIEVILGASITEKDRSEIISIVSKEAPQAKIYQATISQHVYGLDRKEI